MAVLEIVKDGASVLKKTAKRVREIDEDTLRLIEDMKETLDHACGVGLAANQVGVPRRIIVVLFDEGPREFINPKIVKWSGECEMKDEGCLSFPYLYGSVERDRKVTVEAQDVNLKKSRLTVEGLGARAFQHEIDHLNGITFNTRAVPDTLHISEPDEFDEEPDDTTEDCCEDSLPTYNAEPMD